MLTKRTCAALTLAGFLAITPAMALDSSAPTELQAHQIEPDMVELQWQAPDSAPDAYLVYVDGVLHATTTDTQTLVPWAATYAVTALYDDQESAPALASGAVAVQVPTDPQTNQNGECQKFPILIQPNQYPFVFVSFQEDCFNWLWDELGTSPGEIIGGIPRPSPSTLVQLKKI